MIKTYYTDCYKKEIVSTPENETIFYPECGGQPGDRGFADGIRITDTKKAENGDSIYILEDGKTLETGKEYKFTLDWEHRYRFMKMHTCQHMLSGLLYSIFNIGTVAVHLGDEYLTIEVSQDSVSPDVVEELVKRANKVIGEGHKVIYHEKTLEEAESMGLRRSIKVDTDVRLVEIEGVDIIACGGVHVENTSEIQLVMFYKQEMIRGHVRLFFKCAEDAVEYALESRKTVHSLVTALGCSNSELEAKVLKINEELAEKTKVLQQLAEKIAVEEIKASENNGIASFSTQTDLDAFAKASDLFSNLALCATKKTEKNTQWIIILKGKFQSLDFNELRSRILAPAGAKGGGKPPVFRGVAENSDKIDRITDSFRESVESLI